MPNLRQNEESTNVHGLVAYYTKLAQAKNDADKKKTSDAERHIQKQQQKVNELWGEVEKQLQAMSDQAHRGYDAAWARLTDLMMRYYNYAFAQAAVNQAKFNLAIAPHNTGFFSASAAMFGGFIGAMLGQVAEFFGVANGMMQGTAMGAQFATYGLGMFGGVVGGVVGGIGSLFGLCSGWNEGYRAGEKYLLAKPNNDIQCHVGKSNDGSLEYRLKHTNGKPVSDEEKESFINDVKDWANQNNYELDSLNSDELEKLYNDPETGLIAHLTRQMDPGLDIRFYPLFQSEVAKLDPFCEQSAPTPGMR